MRWKHLLALGAAAVGEVIQGRGHAGKHAAQNLHVRGMREKGDPRFEGKLLPFVHGFQRGAKRAFLQPHDGRLRGGAVIGSIRIFLKKWIFHVRLAVKSRRREFFG